MSADFAKRITEAQDRERLERAIGMVRGDAAYPETNSWHRALLTVAAAAEAHLRTLPKPPRYCVVGTLSGAIPHSANFASLDEAMDRVRDLFAQGYPHVGITREPQ